MLLAVRAPVTATLTAKVRVRWRGVLTVGTLPQRARAESDVVIGLGPVGLLPLSITCISIWGSLACVGTWTAIYVFSINLRRSSASFLG